MNTLEWQFFMLLKHFSTAFHMQMKFKVTWAGHAQCEDCPKILLVWALKSKKMGKLHYGMYKKYCMSKQAKVSLILLVAQSKLTSWAWGRRTTMKRKNVLTLQVYIFLVASMLSRALNFLHPWQPEFQPELTCLIWYREKTASFRWLLW